MFWESKAYKQASLCDLKSDLQRAELKPFAVIEMLSLSSNLFREKAEEQQDKERTSLESDNIQKGVFELANIVHILLSTPLRAFQG